MSDLDAELWSTLYLDLVERVLSFLSVPVLCRFRIVCKGWNSLICTPEFGALCIQRGRRDASFIVIREVHGWSFLDVIARHWYTIKRDDPEVLGSFTSVMMAMDGGLVCQHLRGDLWREDALVVVSNPIVNSRRRLPNFAATVASIMPRLSMAVDNIAHTYKIFLMPSGYDRRVELMVIYESTTDRWRNTTFPYTPPRGFRCYGESSIFLDGLLYVLVSSCTTQYREYRYMLWSYNHVEDTWKNTCVNIPIFYLTLPQLIVSDSRLFLASWMRPDAPPQIRTRLEGIGYKTWSQDGWSYEIREVHLEEKTLSTVFEMTQAVMMQLGSVEVKAIGCCESNVLLCDSSSENSIIYDLNTSLWEVIPACPMVRAHGSNRLLWYGSTLTNLTLPQWDPQYEPGSSVGVHSRGSSRRLAAAMASNSVPEDSSGKISRVDAVKNVEKPPAGAEREKADKPEGKMAASAAPDGESVLENVTAPVGRKPMLSTLFPRVGSRDRHQMCGDEQQKEGPLKSYAEKKKPWFKWPEWIENWETGDTLVVVMSATAVGAVYLAYNAYRKQQS